MRLLLSTKEYRSQVRFELVCRLGFSNLAGRESAVNSLVPKESNVTLVPDNSHKAQYFDQVFTQYNFIVKIGEDLFCWKWLYCVDLYSQDSH